MTDLRARPRLHDHLPLVFSLHQGEAALRDTPAPRQLEVRDALLVAFLVSLAGKRDEIRSEQGGNPELPFEPAPLAEQLGLSARLVETAAQWLRRSGVWEEVNGRERKVRFSPSLLERSDLPTRLDWPRVLEAVHGDAGALALALAYLALMRPGTEEWHAISHADAGARMRAGRDAVRRARAVLLEKGLLEERTTPGQTSEVRWSAYARGLGERPRQRPPAPPEPSGTAATPPPLSPPSTDSRSSHRLRLPQGVPVQVQGKLLEIPPGMVAELEMEEGRYYLWLGPVRLGPLDG